MPQLCLAVASLALSTSRPVSVVLLANRLSLVLPYLLWYHTLLSSAVVSNPPARSQLRLQRFKRLRTGFEVCPLCCSALMFLEAPAQPTVNGPHSSGADQRNQ